MDKRANRVTKWVMYILVVTTIIMCALTKKAYTQESFLDCFQGQMDDNDGITLLTNACESSLVDIWHDANAHGFCRESQPVGCDIPADCVGRCGPGCGASGAGVYSLDCAEHDRCCREHGGCLNPFDPECGDEYREAADDFLFGIPNCRGGCLPFDLIFVVDTTGSMWDDIAAVKVAATSIVDEIDSRVGNYRIAVVDYRDFPVLPYGGSGDYPYNVRLPFSTNKFSIISAIQSLSLGWGADWPESVYSALIRSINTEGLGAWRNGAKKVLIVMGDAPPHDPEPFTGYTLRDVVAAAEAVDPASIYSIAIGWDSIARSYFTQLSEGTGGQVVSAPTASQVVDAILTAIEKALQSPTAEAGGPYSGSAGSLITFDASGSSDPDGVVVLYEWDWNNDGTYDESTTSPTITHIWSSGFTGTVKLRVTDNHGLTGIDTASVEVTASLPGDLNDDGLINTADYTVFRTTLGKCSGTTGFIPEADYDGDGCVTYADYKIWYGYYKNQ